MTTTAKIVDYDGRLLTLEPDRPLLRELLQKETVAVELRLDDGRTISAAQRKKVFALIRDISLWSGHEPEYLRQLFTWDFRCQSGAGAFSLSDVDMTTAREFITYLIEFCMAHNVPTRRPLLEYADDTRRYLYQCLAHRKCAVCNAPAQVHHVDRVGMGRDRRHIGHLGLRAIALCQKHHMEAHGQGGAFFEKYHVQGIPLDAYLCQRLGLPTSHKGVIG